MVVDAQAVLVARHHAVHLVEIGAVEGVVEVEGAHVVGAAAAAMAVQAHDGLEAEAEGLQLRGVYVVLQFVAGRQARAVYAHAASSSSMRRMAAPK